MVVLSQESLGLKLLSLTEKGFYAVLRHLHVLSLLLHQVCKSFGYNRWLILAWSLFIESLRILSAFCSQNPGAITYCNKKANRKKDSQQWGCWGSQDLMRKMVTDVTFCVISNKRKIYLKSAVKKILILTDWEKIKLRFVVRIVCMSHA